MTCAIRPRNGYSPSAFRLLSLLCAALLLAFAGRGAIAAPPAPPVQAPAVEAAGEAPATGDATDSTPADTTATDTAEAAEQGSYTPMGPDMIKGQPTSYEESPLASMHFQKQYSDDGQFALWMHDAILLPVIVVISLFVLGLLLFVVSKYRRRENRAPSRTTHNTAIEVIWTLVPVLILVVIAVPSISLLARQYKSPPKDAITIKATGYQWYWGYTYPDQGGFEVISYMLNTPGQPKVNPTTRVNGSEPWDGPTHLEVDNRMVVPVGVPLRIQTTGADVIHSFAVPSLWFKLDAVPGRINERLLTINEPGIYYGQCSELCGAKHGYMPIAIEAVPMERWRQWVLTKGGSFESEKADDKAAGGDAAGGEFEGTQTRNPPSGTGVEPPANNVDKPMENQPIPQPTA